MLFPQTPTLGFISFINMQLTTLLRSNLEGMKEKFFPYTMNIHELFGREANGHPSAEEAFWFPVVKVDDSRTSDGRLLDLMASASIGK